MKENYGITLDNCYVFTKEHRIEVDTDSAQGVLKTLDIYEIYNRFDEYPAKVGWIQIIVKFRAEKILCTLLPCTKCPFEGNMISERKIQWCTFVHCGARRHQKCQENINKIAYQTFKTQKENYGRKKENYEITLDKCYVFTKEHRIEADTDSA